MIVVNRNIALDILKAILSVMVFGIHILHNDSYIINLFQQGFFRLAVPLFYIINGYYLFNAIKDRKYNIWIKRSVILYSVWMLIYSPFWFKGSMSTSVVAVVGYWHLWYVSGMIFGSLVILFVNNFSLRNKCILTLTLLAVGIGIQYGSCYGMAQNDGALGKLFGRIELHRNFIFLSFPFMFIGYLIHQHNVHLRISIKTVSCFLFLGFLMMISETSLNYFYSTDRNFDNLLSTVILAPCIFLVILNCVYLSKQKYISLMSSALYFTHPLAILICVRYFDYGITLMSSALLCSIVLSAIVVYINNRVKILL